MARRFDMWTRATTRQGGGGISEMLSFSPSFFGGEFRRAKSVSDKLHCHRKSDIFEDDAENWELGNREVSTLRCRATRFWCFARPSLSFQFRPWLRLLSLRSPGEQRPHLIKQSAPSHYEPGPAQGFSLVQSRLSFLWGPGFLPGDCLGWNTRKPDTLTVQKLLNIMILLFCYFSLSLFPSLSLSLWRIADSFWWISFIWASEKQLWKNIMCQALLKLFLSISQRAKDREINGHSLHVLANKCLMSFKATALA